MDNWTGGKTKLDEIGLRGAELGSLGTDAVVDKFLGHEDTVDGTVGEIMARGNVEPPQFQPVNQATMECTRGPCQHLWQLTTRLASQSEKIDVARIRQCNCNPTDPTDLTDQNIYHCDQWWPTWLGWVPQWARASLRPRLRAAWEKILKRKGYDFAWRTWSDDQFEADSPEKRKNASVRRTEDLYFT